MLLYFTNRLAPRLACLVLASAHALACVSLYEPPLTRHGQKPLKKKGGDKSKAGDQAGDKTSEKDEASPRAADQLPLLCPGCAW